MSIFVVTGCAWNYTERQNCGNELSVILTDTTAALTGDGSWDWETRAHYLPHSWSWDRSPGNWQDRVLCTQNRGLRLHTFHAVIFWVSANTSYKNRTITTTSHPHRVSRVTKSRALEASGMACWFFVSDEKLKWSEVLANRLELQVVHQRPFSLIHHLTACDPPQG